MNQKQLKTEPKNCSKKKLINNIKSKNTLNPTKKSKQRTKLEICTLNEQQEDGVLLWLEEVKPQQNKKKIKIKIKIQTYQREKESE